MRNYIVLFILCCSCHNAIKKASSIEIGNKLETKIWTVGIPFDYTIEKHTDRHTQLVNGDDYIDICIGTREESATVCILKLLPTRQVGKLNKDSKVITSHNPVRTKSARTETNIINELEVTSNHRLDSDGKEYQSYLIYDAISENKLYIVGIDLSRQGIRTLNWISKNIARNQKN